MSTRSIHPSIHSFIHSSAHLFIHSTYAVHLFLYRFLYHSLLICYSQSASNEGNIHPSSSVCTLISSPSAVFLPLSSSHCYANAAMPDPHHCCLLYISLSLSLCQPPSIGWQSAWSSTLFPSSLPDL